MQPHRYTRLHDLMDDFQNAFNEADIVMITAYGSLETIVHSIALGACDYLEKPLDIEKIKIIPVIKIGDEKDALPLARALSAGGGNTGQHCGSQRRCRRCVLGHRVGGSG